MKDSDVAILLEDISGKLDGVVETVKRMNDRLVRVEERVERIEEQTALIPAIQAAIRDQGTQLQDHENRLDALESAA